METHQTKARQAAAPPTPEQMFMLASATVCAAKETGRKKASSQKERFHVLLPQKHELRIADESGDYTHHVTHKYLGKVGRLGYRHWAMRLTEPYWVCSEDEMASYRTNYAFEWTDKDVLLARRRLKIEMSQLDGDDLPDYGLQPAPFDVSALQPDFLDAANQFEAMSGPDCGQLIDDIRAFSARSIRSVAYSV